MRPSLLAVFLWLGPLWAYAQLTSASFNASSLCVNPAAAVSRPFGHFNMAYTKRNADSAVVPEDSSYVVSPWVQKVEHHQTEMVFTWVQKIFALETYVSYDSVEKTKGLDYSAGAGGQSQKTKVLFLNNMANLGIKLGDKVGFGAKVFSPMYNNKYDDSYAFADGVSTRNEVDEKGVFNGFGFGITAEPKSNYSFGIYVTKLKHTVEGEQNYDNGTTGTTHSNFDGSTSYETKGVGLGYMDGTVKSGGKHFEIGYSRMNSLVVTESGVITGEQFFLTGEISTHGISFGGNVRLVKGTFFDNMHFIELVVDPPLDVDKLTPRFDGFFSFNSTRGHSLGIYGSYWSSKGRKAFIDQQASPGNDVTQLAKTTTYSIGISYSYVF